MRKGYIATVTLVLATFTAGGNPETKPVAGTDLDPSALAVLKSASDTVKNAQNFSFRARTARDRLATNDQIVTYFQETRATVSRPDRLRLDIDGEHHNVQLFLNSGRASIFQPKDKLYASFTSAKTIDSMVEAAQKRGIHMPIANLFQKDPYASLTDGLKTAYVVGRVNVHDKEFVHLAFTEADADWQLWVEMGEKPLPRRAEVIYKKDPGSPRVTVDLMDWNLSPQVAADFFTFNKPADAREINFVKTGLEK